MGAKIVVERDLMVKMRDGVRLATDIYRPDDQARHPVLVHRTPYDKSSEWFTGGVMISPLDAAEHGFIAVTQDTRGRFKSEGEWIPFVNEGSDGYDTIEWAAAQPWSSARVGIWGSSYQGVTTLQATIAAPPHLGAAVSYLTGSNYFNGWTYSGGAFELGFNLWWTIRLAYDNVLRLHSGGGHGELLQKVEEAITNISQIVYTTPLTEIEPFNDGAAPYWQEWLDHHSYDEYWKKIDVAAHADKVQAPILHITGWYDNFLRGHLDLNERLAKNANERIRQSHRLIIGPWEHESYLGIRSSASGEKDFGPSAIGGLPLVQNIAFQWFDYWLTGKETALMKSPRVRFFLMGENRWLEANSWPPSYRPVKYYLHSHGSANSRNGNGILALESPEAEPSDTYVYDPSNPVPTRGGRTLHPAFGAGGIQNQAETEDRKDVLCYTSQHLLIPITIAGPVTLTLFAASNAEDTDFTTKLVDVERDGYCANIAEGIIRARYRNGFDREEFMKPGLVYRFPIDLWHVAHHFKTGHRIRLDVSSSNFPRFDRNLNIKTHPVRARITEGQVAVQQVFHDVQYPSELTLPIMD